MAGNGRYDVSLWCRTVSDYSVALPVSKSLGARVLMLDALASTSASVDVRNECEDLRVLAEALSRKEGGTVNVGDSGTAARFLTAYFALRSQRDGSEWTLDGSSRLRERPVGGLVDALRALGANIGYLGQAGCLPLRITCGDLHAGCVVVDAGTSSQYVSALLMIAPLIGGMTIELAGDVVSRPYIDMTVELMRRYGASVVADDRTISVEPGKYKSHDIDVECDWTSASYWMAWQLLMPQSRIVFKGMLRDSVQGDSRILTHLATLSWHAEWRGDEMWLEYAPDVCSCSCSFYADMTDTPDLVPTMVVLLCMLGRSFRLTGLRSLRLKESDRIDALVHELRRLGYVLEVEGDEAIGWHFRHCDPADELVIDPHGDHRIAMAMSLAAVRFPGLRIADAQVVGKSYPAYWSQLHELGFKVEKK